VAFIDTGKSDPRQAHGRLLPALSSEGSGARTLPPDA
jgi:hypothetical protein